jgi:hypothetical protein
VIGLEVRLPEVPVQESVIVGLFSVTEHEFVLVDDHVIVEVSPERTIDPFAVMERFGLSTVMVTDAWPPFEQMTENCVVDDGLTFVEPDVAPPVEKFTPELLVDAEHDQVSVVLPPEFMVVGFPVKVGGVGGGGGVL